VNFSIIGSGNIATFIGTRCLEAGRTIDEVISTNEETAKALAEKLNAQYLSDFSKSSATTFLLAIPDDAIRSLSPTDFFTGKKVIHTSGSIGLKELENLSGDVACIWPIYSIQNEKLPTRNDIPFVLQSSNLSTRKKAVSFLKCLTNNVTEASDEQKNILHLSAVLVNNFTNHLFAQSEKILRENKLSFNDLMLPIIQNTIEKLSIASPSEWQTGPAKRGDTSTMSKHLELMNDKPILKEIYQLLSAGITELED